MQGVPRIVLKAYFPTEYISSPINLLLALLTLLLLLLL
jgi:hypothetical protein